MLSGMRVHVLERTQRVELSAAEAFAFYGDPANLEPLTPPWLHFALTEATEGEMRRGTRLAYRLRLHGIPIRWRSLIQAWEQPDRFVDVQTKGPYSLWEHTHTFEPDGEGATVIGDHVRYAIPLGPLGALAHALFVRRDLERIFDYRRDALERLVAERAGARAPGA